MKKIEILLVIGGAISIGLRLFSVEGSVIFTFLILGLLAIFYLLLSCFLLNEFAVVNIFKKTNYSSAGWKRIIGSVVIGMAFSIAVLGFLFFVNRWPGGILLLRSAFLLQIPILIVSFANYSKSPFYRNVAIRASVLSTLTLIAFIIVVMYEIS